MNMFTSSTSYMIKEKNVMMIEEIKGHYTLWKDGKEYVVKQRNRLVTRGTKAECYDYMERHPFGTPRKEDE